MDEDLHKLLKLFEIRVIREIEMVKPRSLSLTTFAEHATASSYSVEKERGYEINISRQQLERLLEMLKSKGYYHDDDYEKRMREEDMILRNPELKRMHDEYKMMLYMMCGDAHD